MKRFSPIKVFLVLLALVFVVHQLISSVYKPISVETTYYHTANDGFDITGIVIRNETFVKTKDDGVLHFMLENGERVSKNGAIANIYKNEEASITLSQIDTLKTKISDIENIVSLNNIEAANLDVAKDNVNKSLDSLVYSASFGNFSDVTSKSEQLLSSINRRQAILGESIDFKEQLSALEAQLSSAKASLHNPIGKLKASKSGYFLTKTDGYETAFDIKDLSKVTPEFLNTLEKQDVPSNVVGKIVADYDWYIAAKVTLSQSLNFKEGDSLTLLTNVKSSPELKVAVEKINISKDNSDAVLIFSCNSMNSDLATMRTASMKVVKREYNGLKVSKRALRVVDSVRGVYVVSGMQIKFKPVELVYSGDNFILCEKSDDDGALRLYDQVVVKGKNLYDGKIIS